MRLITYIQTRHQISRRTFVALINKECVFLNEKKITSYTQEVATGDKLKIKAPNFTVEETIQETQKSSTLILLNKPVGYVASKSDPHNKTIYELLPPEYTNYYYIGRLDKNSHGLLLLTDDPALVNEYEHPKFDIEKEYIVELDMELEAKYIQRVLSGIKDENELLRAIKVSLFKKPYHYSVTLNEGKKRHIRRMFKAIGYRVMDLERVREGKYSLGDLKAGEWKTIMM
ncbi:MAG: pseudouridine synthase [Candidatus Absconditabacterales bacterium]